LTYILIFYCASAWSFQTNELRMVDAPVWVKRTKVQKITDRIQQKLEWRIRRVDVIWFSSESKFGDAQGLGPQALAVTQSRGTQANVQVLLGPRVNQANYEVVLGHELVHVIILQKYKTSIPKWLEEGLANHLSKQANVDYVWLKTRPSPQSIEDLSHPLKGNPAEIRAKYMFSQALAEMIDRKCDFENLLRLSVERKLEDYLRRTCGLTDVGQELKAWVARQSAS